MSDIGQLVKQGVDPLGRGAYLVSLVPSATLIMSLLAIFTSHLYPGSATLRAGNSMVRPGPAAVAFELKGLTAVGDVLLVIGIVVGTVLLRPFQISLDQILEGHWQERGRRRVIKALATERHLRRWSIARWRIDAYAEPAGSAQFAEVAFQERDRARQYRLAALGARVEDQYPADRGEFMPTLLGNVLRRSETSAGERYGLETIVVYPRLYPFIGDRLDRNIVNQLDMIDTMSTFTFVFLILAAATAPIGARLDGWSALPILLCLASSVCSRAAVLAAGRYGVLVASAFDLYRFDMIHAMHRPLPQNLEVELIHNRRLSKLLTAPARMGQSFNREWRYRH